MAVFMTVSWCHPYYLFIGNSLCLCSDNSTCTFIRGKYFNELWAWMLSECIHCRESDRPQVRYNRVRCMFHRRCVRWRSRIGCKGESLLHRETNASVKITTLPLLTLLWLYGDTYAKIRYSFWWRWIEYAWFCLLRVTANWLKWNQGLEANEQGDLKATSEPLYLFFFWGISLVVEQFEILLVKNGN